MAETRKIECDSPAHAGDRDVTNTATPKGVATVGSEQFVLCGDCALYKDLTAAPPFVVVNGQRVPNPDYNELLYRPRLGAFINMLSQKYDANKAAWVAGQVRNARSLLTQAANFEAVR